MGDEDHPKGGAAATPEPPEAFDALLEKLRRVVEALEGGKLTLEQSLEAFEQGVRLSRRGNAILDEAERRVELLSRGADGVEIAVPFPDAADPSER